MRQLAFLILATAISEFSTAQTNSGNTEIMNGYPPSRESQVTFENYRDYPFSKWSFHNMGAPCIR